MVSDCCKDAVSKLSDNSEIIIPKLWILIGQND